MLSDSGNHICFISSSVRQCVIISLLMSVGEDGISVGSVRIARISFAARVTVVDELSGRSMYLRVTSAIAYYLSMMVMVGILSI